MLGAFSRISKGACYLRDGFRLSFHFPLSSIKSHNAFRSSFQREFNTEYLSSPDTWELPEATQIAFPRPRNALRRRTADLVQSLYARLYEAISDSRSGYSKPWPEDLKTPEQVAALLLPSSSGDIS